MNALQSTTRGVYLALDFCVPPAIPKINYQPNQQPNYQTNPIVDSQVDHHCATKQNPQNWHQRHQWRFERPGSIGIAAPHHQNTHTNQDKSKQSANTGHFPYCITRYKSCKDACKHKQDQVRFGGCAETWMDVGKYFGNQAIARHGYKYPTLRHQVNQYNRCKSK